MADETEHLDNSYIGQIGKAIEPVIRPLGFDWKMGVGILSGIGAKELVVSTLGVLYTNDDGIESVDLADRIPITPLVAYGYMLFVLIYFPCIATVAAIKNNPLLPQDIIVHGLLFCPDTGRLEVVVHG